MTAYKADITFIGCNKHDPLCVEVRDNRVVCDMRCGDV